MASSFGDTPNYFEEALGELKKRAASQHLRVDAAATHALELNLNSALAEAEQQEGVDALSSLGHYAEFNQSIAVLAIEATKAARADNAEWVQPEHIAIAINELQFWGFWPFKGD